MFRRSGSDYVPIEHGQGPGLASEVLGLHLARDGYSLRLYDPATGRKLPTVREEIEAAEAMQAQFEKARRLAAAEVELADLRRQLVENNLKITEAQLDLTQEQLDQVLAENECLRQENEALRCR